MAKTKPQKTIVKQIQKKEFKRAVPTGNGVSDWTKNLSGEGKKATSGQGVIRKLQTLAEARKDKTESNFVSEAFSQKEKMRGK